MQAPLDYPVTDQPIGSSVKTEDITYAKLLDRHAAKQQITDEMIRQACLLMEAAQQLPFAHKASPKPLDSFEDTSLPFYSKVLVNSKTSKMRGYWKRHTGLERP